MIVYRRNRAQMPAHEEEADEAEREGVRINWLRTITAFDGPELTVEVMELDEQGRPQPTGRLETLAADTLILALGQDADTGFLRRVPGVEFEPRRDGRGVDDDDDRLPGVFAGGDMVPAERTVTVGVGHGKKAARLIDAWLRGDGRPPRRRSTDVAAFDMLHLWYFGDAAPRAASRARARRSGSPDFDEVSAGSPASRPRYEAGGACRAAIASSATAASALARKTRSSSSAPGTGTGSITTGAPDARPASSSARARDRDDPGAGAD